MNPVNPYLYAMKIISGKWKTTILHHIHANGYIRFNQTKKTLPISEKVLSQQLKELEKDGLVERIQYQVMHLKVKYILTPIGQELIPALDIIYIWSIKRMHERNIPIDPDAFDVHKDKKYIEELGAIMKANKVSARRRKKKKN
ncbi:helix-turn-helix domain-containing protein [uncultured Brachyspira sp.]|uniref:winged helix-turn-helix transcriptional regulator n=1 Tax=uncultured Brachyspira sp. TaxID=221953 RepID=UPI002614CFFC|nr:helix-turn-helix domain-containing protein [uncultured Brachyspira sp.]